MKHQITLLLIFLNILFALGQDDQVVLNWQFGKLGNEIAQAGILAMDIDRDGKDEIITTGNSTGQASSTVDKNYFISILKYDNISSQYQTLWLSGLYPYKITALAVDEIDENGSYKIFLGFENGDIVVYDESLKEVAYWETTNQYSSTSIYSINDIILGDIDNDSKEDLIAITKSKSFIYDIDYNLEKTIPYGAYSISLGDIDSDGQQEVVYSNGQIIEVVADNINFEFKIDKFAYNDYVSIELEDFNNDNTIDLVYSSRDTLYAFDYKNKSEIWSKKWVSIDGHNYIDHIYLSDFDQDGTNDIFIGERSYDGIYGYNGTNGNLVFDLFDYVNRGVTNVVIGDFDNDNEREIVATHGVSLSGVDELIVYDLNSKSEEWRNRLITNSFKVFDVGDLDNDGDLEIVSANFSYEEGSFITVFNGATKTIENQNIEPLTNFRDEITSLKIGDIDNDGKNDLLVGIKYDDPQIYVHVLDLEDYSIKRSFLIEGMSLIMDIAISDIDLDGVNEVVVTTGTQIGGSSNPDEWQNYIYIFNGTTGEIEWKSPQIGGVGSRAGSIKIANIDQDDALEVVTFLYSKNKLFIIDGVSHDFIEVSMDVNVVELSDFNDDGINEIVVGSSMGELNILSGTTLEPIKEYGFGLDNLTALEIIDLNNDDLNELVVSDGQKLYIYDTSKEKIVWKSAKINKFAAGSIDSFIASDLNKDNNIDFIFNGGHALYNFEVLDYDAIDQKLVLSADNFSVIAVGETCENKNNGQILITTLEPNTYTAKLNDEIFQFDNASLEIYDLKPGNYNLCIYVNGYDFEQCFDLEIPSAELISGKSTLSSKQVVFQMDTGTLPYSVFKNGLKIFETTNKEFSVSVEDNDVIGVKSAFECEGMLLEKANLEAESILFPNPSRGEIKVKISNSQDNVDIVIYDLLSKMVHQQSYPIVDNYLSIGIENLPSGTYFLKILADKTITKKIIKL